MARARWLTPSAPPENRFYTRRLLIPATAEFLGLVNGALLELCHEFNWEEHGDWTPEETAEYFLNMFQAYHHNENEPPDWETPDEADGQPEQVWYEDLADWIIQGFLAVTFTPAAAIVYTATVPKLRVAIRTGNLGALFKVLINGVEVWTGDSYGPITDLIEQVFDMSAETEPYTVRIEHNGIGEGHGLTTAKLEVIRGKAVADMVATILRADPAGCGVQWSTDNGDTWDTVDLATCITGLANDAIIQAVNSGYLQRAGGQTGPASPPEAEECKSYHVKLRADGRWTLPSLVNTGDTIEITDATGGWSDGSAAWFCPDGSAYLIGQCLSGDGDTDSGDPLNTVNHMQIIGQIGEGNYVDPYTAVYTIPAVTVDQRFTLLCNDSSLADNSGEVEFDVTVCTGVPSDRFCFEYDFTAGTQDWYQKAWPVDPSAVYSAGNGWGFGGEYNVIERNFGAGNLVGTTVDTIEVWRTFTPGSNRVQMFFYDQDNQQSGILYDNYAGFSRETVGGLIKDTWSLTWNDMLKLTVFGDNSALSGYVTKIVLRGPTPAYWSSNCT